MSWPEGLGARAWLGAGAVCTVVVVIAFLGTARAMAFDGEFADPSPNGPPTATAYNTAALSSCPVTRSEPYCELDAPNSALPAADPDNPESYLNSAYWPAEERPDIEVYGVQQFGYNYHNCSDPSTGIHYCFLVDAEAGGYPVTQTPQVGDLFLAQCENFIMANGATATNCPLGTTYYYVGYVQQVFPDGSFIITAGGTGPGDSGLAFEWLSGSMDPNSDFIGFFPPAQSPHLPSVEVEVDLNSTSSDTGAGTISDTSGQTCTTRGSPTTCVFSEPQGVPVTFTATPQAGSTVADWGGDGCVGVAVGNPCTITFTSMGGSGLNGSILGGPGADFQAGSNSGNSSFPSTGPARPAPNHGTAKLGIVRVTTASATIHASLRGSNLVCKLSKWNGRRWGHPRVARCGSSVTYRHLAAGRYRLTVASGKKSATKIIVLRHGVITHVTKPSHSVRSDRTTAT